MSRFWTRCALFSGLFAGLASNAFAEDSISCVVKDKTLVCKVALESFMESASSLMTNGWENQIDIQFEFINNNNDVLKTSTLHASQRCYIDPFESPCLVLWRGAKTWKTYHDDKSFLKSFSNLTVHAMKFTELEPDNYNVRMTITVKAGSEREYDSVKQIFKQTGNDLRLGDSSLVGSFISAYTPALSSSRLYIKTLETSQFYIDLNFQYNTEASNNNNLHSDNTKHSPNNADSTSSNNQSTNPNTESSNNQSTYTNTESLNNQSTYTNTESLNNQSTYTNTESLNNQSNNTNDEN